MASSSGGPAGYAQAHALLSSEYILSPFPVVCPPGEWPVVQGAFRNFVEIFSIQRDDGRQPVIPNAHALPGCVIEARSNYSGFHAVKFPYAASAGGAVLLVYSDGVVNSVGARSELRTALSAVWLLNTLRVAYGTNYSVSSQFKKTNTVICAALPWLINLDHLRKWKYTAGHSALVFPGVFVHIGKIAAPKDPQDRSDPSEKHATVSILIYTRWVIISGMTDMKKANALLELLIPNLSPFRKTPDVAPAGKRLRTQ